MFTKAFVAVLGVVFLVCFCIGFGLVMGFLGFQNTANQFEIDVKAQYTDNRNVYDNGYKKVMETAQVPAQYAGDLKQLYTDTMTARYGADGSKAMLQFITEHNPTLDSSLYKQIQQTIEIFRNRFQQSQTELISRQQAYEVYLHANTSSRFYNWVSGNGYPTAGYKEYGIVTSAKTENAFTTKQDEPLQLKR